MKQATDFFNQVTRVKNVSALKKSEIKKFTSGKHRLHFISLSVTKNDEDYDAISDYFAKKLKAVPISKAIEIILYIEAPDGQKISSICCTSNILGRFFPRGCEVKCAICSHAGKKLKITVCFCTNTKEGN